MHYLGTNYIHVFVLSVIVFVICGVLVCLWFGVYGGCGVQLLS